MSGDLIDLRSDAVTRPTMKMRSKMSNAKVGAFLELTEDPTVMHLEELSASIMGKEAALLTTSGTQANLIATLTHTRKGDEVLICENHHHLIQEVSGLTVLAGVVPRIMENHRGVINSDAALNEIKKRGTLQNPIGLIWLENSHNNLGGIAISPDEIKSLVEIAKNNKIPIHMDGARIFNAAHALGIKCHEITKSANSVMFCLTKGLSCPVGSMLAGSKSFIEEAGRIRKMLGGGMRQAGIFAAAGIVALEKMLDQIGEDNENAKIIENGLNDIEEISIVPVETNLIKFDLTGSDMTASKFEKKMAEENILVLPIGKSSVRLAIHRHHGKKEISRIVKTIKKYFLK